MSRQDRRDEGFTLIEVVVALFILAIVAAFISTGMVASSSSTQKSQTRLIAQQIASKAIQQVQALGYSTASEGIECSSSSCTTLGYADPLNQIQSGGNGCFYFVPTGTSLSTTTDPIVPVQYVAAVAGTDSPIVPNVSGNTGFAKPSVDGTSYKVVVYPMFNQTEYSNVSCTTEVNDTAPAIPLTVVVEVAWGHGFVNQISTQTALYDGPQPLGSAGNCPTPAAEAGAHNEQLMGNEAINTVGPWTTSNASTWTSSTSVASGDWVSVMFSDEQSTPYTPSVCISDSSGDVAEVPVSSLTDWTVTQMGTSSTNPYYSGKITPVHPPWQTGSSPNAGQPPTGGTYCTSGNCALEEVFSFIVPATYGSVTVSSLTVADWDHEGDLDFAEWTVT